MKNMIMKIMKMEKMKFQKNWVGIIVWISTFGLVLLLILFSQIGKIATHFAKHGNAEAQHTLGMMYHNGDGVSQNGFEAVKWTRKAAEKGLLHSQYILATLYDNRLGFTGKGRHRIPKDEAEAFRWYLLSAKGGYAYSQCELGEIYSEGRGVSQDYERAFEWFHKAAKQGDVKAQAALGEIYSEGKGVSQDYEKAFEWFQKAVDQVETQYHGNAFSDAFVGLGEMYLEGRGVEKDEAESYKWVLLAALQGHKGAQTDLEKLRKELTPHQRAEGHWRAAQKARKKGMRIALRDSKLVFIFPRRPELNAHYSSGVPKDEKAFEWFHQAAENGNAEAQHRLGVMYSEGHGVEKNEVEAYKWLLLSAAQGHKNAMEIVKVHAENLTQKDQDQGQQLADQWKPKMQK